MGNTSKKLAAKCTLLEKDEQKCIAAVFRSASKNSERIREDDLIVSGTVDPESLEKFWGPQIDPRLAKYLSNYLFGCAQNKASTVQFNRFAELYVYNTRGNVDERVMVTYNSLGCNHEEGSELPYQLIKEYCEALASTYIKMLKQNASGRTEAWVGKGFAGRAQHVQSLGEAVAASVGGDTDSAQHVVTSQQVARWLQTDTLLMHISEMVFSTLYGVNRRSEDIPAITKTPSLLPMPEGLDAMPDYPAFIDLSHIVWLNSHLPRKLQHKWRFLFSSHIHGESFSTLAGRIIDHGPTILIIEDNSGYVFGGFATHSWAFGPNFTGGEDSFVFTLAPRMRVFTATGYNDHYQYMNHHTKTLPNGLMMGGQFQFGGIWIDAEPFGAGASAESCTTYRGYRRLSKEPTFHIRSLEVWGVGDEPVLDKDSDERDTSILDVNPEAKAILEMAGKTSHSEGLREPPPL